jgi:hypothetical protein
MRVQPDEEAIVEVARDIRNPQIRAKYLRQVLDDEESCRRLEHRIKSRRRWQFSVRTLLLATILMAMLSVGVGISYRQAVRAHQAERIARFRAEQAYRIAVQARRGELSAAEATRQIANEGD